jgi:hypothetical protein
MKAESSPPESPKLASTGSSRLPGPRFSLRWLLVAMAFLAVVVSHVNTSLELSRARQLFAQQQFELKRLRDELGVFEISDVTKTHIVFVRQNEEKSWRWRVYLPPGGYMMKWAIDDIPNDGLASRWEGQDFRVNPNERLTFTVDVFLRKGADGTWRVFLRHPWGELKRELPEDHVLLSPTQPVVIVGDPGRYTGQLSVCDPRQPLVFFRYRVIPQSDFDAAQTNGKIPPGPHPGIMVWIEPAK